MSDTVATAVERAEAKPAGSTMTWVITLFGTAVGAGILFLPLNAGGFGFWPLVFATVFILPLVYFSHRTFLCLVMRPDFRRRRNE